MVVGMSHFCMQVFPHEYRRALQDLAEEVAEKAAAAAEVERLRKEKEEKEEKERLELEANEEIEDYKETRQESLDNMYDEDVINELGEDGKEVSLLEVFLVCM